jgi:hypothetical protein
VLVEVNEPFGGFDPGHGILSAVLVIGDRNMLRKNPGPNQ